MRIGASVWHSSRIEIENAEIAEFETPTKIVTRANYFTCMPMTARGGIQMLAYGETASNYWTIIANSRAFSGKIKEGDLMWVDGQTPNESIEEEYGVGASANAIVKSVSEVNATINIILERNQNQVKQ